MRAIQKFAVALVGVTIPFVAVRAETNGIWARIPWPSEVLNAYPHGVGGAAEVQLHCVPSAAGDLTDCSVVSEEPSGQGFGAGALSLTTKFRLTKAAAKAYAAGVILPIKFEPRQNAPPWREAIFRSAARFKYLGPSGPFFPDLAARMGVSGEVLEDCHVDEGGKLDACKLVSVAPGNFGFEYAVAAMIKKGWMTAGPPPAGVAPPADGVWRFRVPFDAPGAGSR